MTIDRSALRKLASEATAGHWSVQGPWPHATIYAFDNPDLREDVEARHIASSPLILRSDQKCADDADMAFIAAANPQAVIDLLDQLDRAEAAAEHYREQVSAVAAISNENLAQLSACRAALEEACDIAKHFADMAGHPDDSVAIAALERLAFLRSVGSK